MADIQQVKLFIFAEGEAAAAFLEDVQIALEPMKENWNIENPNAVTSIKVGGGGVQHGF